MVWEPTGPEDRLLKAYHDKVGGRMYTEVYLNSCRLDGVLVHDSRYKDDIVKFRDNKRKFASYRSASITEFPNPSIPYAEAIEVRKKPYRDVIGQADGGRFALKKYYPFFEIRKAVALVSDRPHTDIVEFAEQKDVEIETISEETVT